MSSRLARGVRVYFRWRVTADVALLGRTTAGIAKVTLTTRVSLGGRGGRRTRTMPGSDASCAVLVWITRRGDSMRT